MKRDEISERPTELYSTTILTTFYLDLLERLRTGLALLSVWEGSFSAHWDSAARRKLIKDSIQLTKKLCIESFETLESEIENTDPFSKPSSTAADSRPSSNDT